MSKFDTIGLITQSTLPSAVAGDVVFQASKMRVYNGSAWETFSAVDPSGNSSTITMGASQQVLAEGGSTNPADGAPSYAFTGDLDTGIWNPSDGTVRIASDGNGVAEFEHGTGLKMLTGQVLGTDGSVGAPAFSNDGDTNTGMWFPADDTVAFSTAGNQALTILPSGLVQVNTAGYQSLLANDNDIPNKGYVDSLSAGLDPKQSVRVATTADLDTETGLGTWAAAGSGQGKTLTAGAAGALVLDTSITCVLGDRVLVKDESGGLGASHNGIYEVTTNGNALAEITEVDFTSHTISDGDYWTLNSANDATAYYVWYGTTDPTPGGTGINVALQASPAAYATATASAINGQADFGSPAPGGNVITVTNAATGPTTDAADVNASVAVTVTQDGKAASATVLTRADDQDGTPSSEVSGGNFTTVESGTSQYGTMWAVVWDGDVVVDTDPINWTQIGGVLPASAYPLYAPVSATPQYSFNGDTDTGIASPSANQLDLYAGNTAALSLTASGTTLGANLDVGTFDIVSTGANHIDIIAAANGAGSGRDVNIAGGQGTQDGGAVNIDGGVGGAGFDGGDVLVYGGVNNNAINSVGHAWLRAGESTAQSNNPAHVHVATSFLEIQGRNILAGTGTGGDVQINGGQSYGAAAGGDVDITGGPAGQATGTPGYINLICGSQVGGSAHGNVALRCGEATAGVLEFREALDGANYIGLKAPDSLSADVTYSLPTAGVEGQHLKLGASNALEWDSDMAELSVQTTNDTETELVGPGTTYYTIASGTTHAVEILVVGEKSDGSEAAMWKVLVGIKNVAGTTSLVGSDTTTTISNTPGWTLAVSADDTNDRLAVKVTGAAATTINWKAKITAVQV